MSRLRRAMRGIAVIGLIAGGLALLYDAATMIIWDGSRKLGLVIQAPQSVRSVLYACCDHGEAEYYRELPLEARELIFRSDHVAKSADRQSDGSFQIVVETSGRESGLRILQNSHSQRPWALILVELENGERWMAILTLPDVTKVTTLPVRIPDDVRRTRPPDR